MTTKSPNPALAFMAQHVPAVLSPIRVLFTSRSSAGAWQIRGEQVAATRSNWSAINRPSDADLEACDLLCIVKKPDANLVERARRMGKPIVYDIVDSWAQPDDGFKYNNVATAREFFGRIWRQLDADGYIFPTRRMQLDLGSLVPCAITIYHHYWPQMQRNPIREQVLAVGYEGADYLGEWRERIDHACADRGIQFVANPASYTDLDIVVLARGGDAGNFLSRSYKSNVKLANAYGSGTPALVHADEMSAHDTDTGDVLFFSDQPGSFERQLERLVARIDLRRRIHASFLAAAPRFHVSTIARHYEGFFMNVLAKKDRHKNG